MRETAWQHYGEPGARCGLVAGTGELFIGQPVKDQGPKRPDATKAAMAR
jgi:hypothetical protein